MSQIFHSKKKHPKTQDDPNRRQIQCGQGGRLSSGPSGPMHSQSFSMGLAEATAAVLCGLVGELKQIMISGVCKWFGLCFMSLFV